MNPLYQYVILNAVNNLKSINLCTQILRDAQDDTAFCIMTHPLPPLKRGDESFESIMLCVIEILPPSGRLDDKRGAYASAPSSALLASNSFSHLM